MSSSGGASVFGYEVACAPDPPWQPTQDSSPPNRAAGDTSYRDGDVELLGGEVALRDGLVASRVGLSPLCPTDWGGGDNTTFPLSPFA